MARYDRTIPPGGEGKITLEVKTKGFQGKFQKSARVLTNDPKSRQLILGLSGNVWVPIQVNPRYGHLKGVVGDVVERTIVLKAMKEEPLEVALVSVSVPDKIDVHVKALEKGRTYQVFVKNKVAGTTSYNGQIVLKTNYPELPELKVRVTANIRPAVEARPNKLNFGRLSQQQIDRLKTQKRPMSRPVMVILNKGAGLEVTDVALEHSLFKTTVKPMGNNRMVQIVVEADFEKLKKGINKDLLKIKTNQQGAEELRVPISFERM